MQISNRDLERFREIIYRHTGISLNRHKNYLLSAKLQKIMMRLHYEDLDSFYKLLESENRESLDNLINYVTTNHTFFFREKSHLDILVNNINRRGLKNINIWCAASSSGEEAYSIAIYLLENRIKDFLIIASDIKREVLIHMKKGIYQKYKLNRTPPLYIQKYFRKIKLDNAYQYKISPAVKKHVRAKKINLIRDMQFYRPFDYIFCRNVMIYFDTPTTQKVVAHLLNNLHKNGLLFIGHSENLFNITGRAVPAGPAVYKKKE